MLVEERDFEVIETAEGVSKLAVESAVTPFDADADHCYIINFDGKEYVCPLVWHRIDGGDSLPMIGNLAIGGFGDDTGEPFVGSVQTAYDALVGFLLLTNLSGDSHTVSISELSETIKTIDPEFLPALTSPNGTKYQLTVSDDGTLSAVAVS